MNDVITYEDSVTHVYASAHQTYFECMETIAAAYQWASSYEIAKEYLGDNAKPIDYENAKKAIDKRTALAVEMELSFLRNWAQLTGHHIRHDGDIHIIRDGFCSFFWRYPKSGYHGGLIFHKNYSVPIDVKVGTWSIHT